MKDSDRVIQEYVASVIPQMYKDWLGYRAHSVDYGFPEQSLFWHATDAALKALDLLDYFMENTTLMIARPDELALCATFHDLDRTFGKREYDVTLEELADVRSRMGLNDYASTLSNDDLLWVVRNHHFFRHTGHLEGRLGDNRLSALLYLTTLADGLAVIRNPREVVFSHDKRDRATSSLLESFTSQRFEFGYHQLNAVTGFVSNLLHSVIVEFLRKTLPETERNALHSLAFFPNGTVYIAPKETFDRCLNAVPAEEFLLSLTQEFYAKFREVLEKTGQFLALEKGQPTPAPFAFLMDAASLVDTATRRAQRDWHIVQRQQQRLEQIRLELQAGDQTERAQERLQKEQKRLEENLARRVEKLRDQVEKLLKQHEDLVKRYGKPGSHFDFAALKVISDYFAFVIRTADAYGVSVETLNLLATETGLDTRKLQDLTVKGSGGVNYQAILLAYHMLQTPPEPAVDDTYEEADDFLAAGDAVRPETISSVARLKIIAARVQEFCRKRVGAEQQLQALVKHELLGAEVLAEFDPTIPLQRSLLDELSWILSEYLEVNGLQFPVCKTDMNTLCNFCGRRCRGITLSAKVTPVDTPTTYSGYNLAESTDNKPRRICALCFFENALRKVLFPNRGKGLTLFVFPEYSFTRHHANIFHRQVRDRFPKALEQEETGEIEGSRDALLAAIQWVLRAQPEETTADAILPVLVVPLSGDTSLEWWLSHTKNLLQLWDGLGLKYILTPDFYPEVEGIGDVRGAVELRGCHPMLETRLRRWMQALRPQPIRGLPATVLTIPEAAKAHQLMQAVSNLAADGTQEKQFYSTPGSFSGAVLYGRDKEKAKRKRR